MSRRHSLLASACLCLLTTGCTGAPDEPAPATSEAPTTVAAPSPTQAPTSTPTPTPTSVPGPLPTPAPSSTPTPTRVVTVTLDGFTHEVEGGIETVPFDDGDMLVDFLSGLSGSTPVVTDIDDPWGNGTTWGTAYEWDGIGLSDFEESANVRVQTAEVGGARLQTAEGIAVGSTREESMAAGATAVWDEDGDGVADLLGIGSREVPGTQSLSRPGSVGVEYLMLTLEGDVVTRIDAPADDFSDI